MARLNTYLLAAACVFIALATGHVMQQNAGPSGGTLPEHELVVSGITETSSAAPLRPSARLAAVPAIAPMPDSAPAPVRPDVAEVPDCAITANATPQSGAMVLLEVAAPCYPAERVTIHHHGMMFTEVTDPRGNLRISAPALSETALFVFAFDGGEGATATAAVPVLYFYDRVVLQWDGAPGLELHAREFGAGYASDGHIWAGRKGDMVRSAAGTGGFLTTLGDPDAPNALLAQVYSFPAGTAQRAGDIALTVEAEVTEANCGREISAQTLELRGEGGIEARDLTLDIPGCEITGDFLVLKNVIEDLKIAAR